MKHLLPILLLAWLAGCATTGRERVLTPADVGHKVTVGAGAVLVVELPANHTTGYLWSLLGPTNDVLMPLGQPAYMQDSSPFGMVGIGGTEIWRFKTIGAGRGNLKLGYQRPWETNLAPAKVMEFEIQVLK